MPSCRIEIKGGGERLQRNQIEADIKEENSMISQEELVPILHHSQTFQHFTQEECQAIIGMGNVKTFEKNTVVIHEGEEHHALYFVLNGHLKVSKAHDIAEIGPGELIGEMSLNVGDEASATIITTTDTTLLEFNAALFRENPSLPEKVDDVRHANFQHVIQKFYHAIYVTITRRQRRSNHTLKQALDEKTIYATQLERSGRLLSFTMITMSLYIFFLRTLHFITDYLASTTYATAALMAIFLMTFMVCDRFQIPRQDLGLTLSDWQYALVESLKLTFPILLAMVGVKWLLITTVDAHSHESLFHPFGSLNPHAREQATVWSIVLLSVIYAIFVVAQEMISRGIVQNLLYQQFQTYRTDARWPAILLANLVFIASHVHVSVTLAFVVFPLGLLWGWLFSRHQSLLGAIVSHIVIGVFGIFVLSFNFLVKPG
ncbi:MAG: cyclic nucleotide-binding domain-containing protein [Desulfobacterales bacterium]|nr:cyclic nucleotide-binding domain-containing protein [Desulfobacterales bacterium]